MHFNLFLKNGDLDYEQDTIIRREILPSGKSRAFVNDTPVTLSVLNALKVKLMDVHSQHQTSELSDVNFQFTMIDALSKNQTKIGSYKRGLKQLNTLKKELLQIEETQREANQQYDYNLHLFEELEAANLVANEQETLEVSLDKLNNVEEIQLHLSAALSLTISDEIGIQNLLSSVASNLQKVAPFSKEYEAIATRFSSLKIELDDLVGELENANELLEFNPNEAEKINDRLQLIYNLQKKHYVNSISDLISIQTTLSEKLLQKENAEENITAKNKEIEAISEKLDKVALSISDARIKTVPKLKKSLEQLLSELGMENARFSIQISPSQNYFTNGKDELQFLFSANKGGNFGELKKVASGGELSRIMLSVKKILSEHTQLPTIIFDEIDTGVSGEISNKIAQIMQQMSQHMQVITITHLPQIAAKGAHHYKVFKSDVNGKTTTNLKQLSPEERIIEIAEMLSGKEISDSALTHAKELLH